MQAATLEDQCKCFQYESTRSKYFLCHVCVCARERKLGRRGGVSNNGPGAIYEPALRD